MIGATTSVVTDRELEIIHRRAVLNLFGVGAGPGSAGRLRLANRGGAFYYLLMRSQRESIPAHS